MTGTVLSKEFTVYREIFPRDNLNFEIKRTNRSGGECGMIQS